VMAEKLAQFPCPKCNRLLTQSGDISIGDSPALLPTFQCDECLKIVELFGVKHEVALTFAVQDGQPFDPAAADGVLRF